MSSKSASILFVSVNSSGQPEDPEDDHAVRSHVRRAIARSRKDKVDPFRFVHVDQANLDKRRSSATKNNRVAANYPNRVRSTAKHQDCSAARSSAMTSAATARLLDSSLATRVTVYHPFTTAAARSVPLPTVCIDRLFKSDAFRFASEPCFDSSHADAAFNMEAVFPGSLNEPVFLNALLYAMTQASHSGAPNVEGLMVQTRTIELLNERLATSGQHLSPAVIGAVMLLKSAAYKYHDPDSHMIHTDGLMKALKTQGDEDVNDSSKVLTAAAQRAMFWLDLFAGMLMGCERHVSHLIPSQRIYWQREHQPRRAQHLPIGFVRHRAVLPQSLLECISDTVEMQSLLHKKAAASMPHHTKHFEIDDLQGSLESRLAQQGTECQAYGPLTEAVRLGVFLCVYCSWVETWNCFLVPCRLGEELQKLLLALVTSHEYEADFFWANHLDLITWLYLLLKCVLKLDGGRNADLQLKQQFLADYVRSSIEYQQAWRRAVSDFLYFERWRESGLLDPKSSEPGVADDTTSNAGTRSVQANVIS